MPPLGLALLMVKLDGFLSRPSATDGWRCERTQRDASTRLEVTRGVMGVAAERYPNTYGHFSGKFRNCFLVRGNFLAEILKTRFRAVSKMLCKPHLVPLFQLQKFWIENILKVWAHSCSHNISRNHRYQKNSVYKALLRLGKNNKLQ